MKSFALLIVTWFAIYGGEAFCVAATAKPRYAWNTEALRLSGESQAIANQSIARLKAMPNLEPDLKAALAKNNTDTYLALDVIATLKKEELIPDVLKASANDPSGFFDIALTSFLAGPHGPEILARFDQQLGERSGAPSKNAPPPVKMVVLDTYGRMRRPIAEKLLANLLGDEEAPEVRSAALYYLRAFLKTHDHRFDKIYQEFRSEKNLPESLNAQLAALTLELYPESAR